MTYPNVTLTINSIAHDIRTNEIILLSADRTINEEPLEYAIWFTHNYSNIAIRIVTVDSITVKDYLVSNAEKAESKFKWLINKYDLKVTSIMYVAYYLTAEIVCDTYSIQGKLAYSYISTPTIPLAEVTVSYQIFDEHIDYQELVCNFDDFNEMLAGHKPPIKILPPRISPRNFVRKKKLASLDFLNV